MFSGLTVTIEDVHVLTRALANELGDSGITANPIAPGQASFIT